MVWYIDQIFREMPTGLAIGMAVFLGLIVIIWLLLPLWVLFIQWNTGKIRDEIRNLADLIEKKDREEKKNEASIPSD